jgi:hypothetical protein
MAYEGNQFSYYQNIQLDEDGALIVSVDGLTGGTSSSLGTDFGFELNKDLYYNLQSVSDDIINYGVFENYVIVRPFVPKQTLTINQLNIYATASGTSQLRIVCFNSVNGLPRDLLFQSPIITANTVGNYVYNTSYTFNAGTTYWIGTYGNGGTSIFLGNDKVNLSPIGQGTGGATPNYTVVTGISTFPNSVSTFPTPGYTNVSTINIRFKFD